MSIPLLLIDDEDNLRNLMTRILSLEGYKVDSTSEIENAKSFLEKNSYPVIITDVKLPDGDGVDFVKFIKYNYPDTEVIVITDGLTFENLTNNSSWNEAQFDTESRLQSETDPVSELHYTPGTPFNVKGNFTINF